MVYGFAERHCVIYLADSNAAAIAILANIQLDCTVMICRAPLRCLSVKQAQQINDVTEHCDEYITGGTGVSYMLPPAGAQLRLWLPS